LRIGRRIETGRRSESHTPTLVYWNCSWRIDNTIAKAKRTNNNLHHTAQKTKDW